MNMIHLRKKSAYAQENKLLRAILGIQVITWSPAGSCGYKGT